MLKVNFMKSCSLIAILLVIFLYSGCKKDDSIPTQSTIQTTELEGTWTGTDTSKFAWNSTFSGSSLDLRRSDSTRWYTGTFTMNDVSTPKTINFSINQSSETQSVGKILYGIYKIESGALAIAFSALGDTVNPVDFTLATGNVFALTFQPPVHPTLSTPKNGTVNTSLNPVLSWVPSSGAVNYTIHVSTKNEFTDSIFFQNNIKSVNKQISGLINNKRYYWRVSASNKYSTSVYSDTGSFTTLAGLPCDSVPTVVYEGKTYNTVQIGNQCWMKENLDVGTRINAADTSKNDSLIQKYCYGDDANNCTKYGALYTWDEAMKYATAAGTQGICPSGWHIPTIDEYDSLLVSENSDANALKSVGQGLNGGAGTNLSGFSALLAGTRYYGESYNYIGYTANLWSSTLGTLPYHAYLTKYFGDMQFFTNDRRALFSVRCVKNK